VCVLKIKRESAETECASNGEGGVKYVKDKPQSPARSLNSSEYLELFAGTPLCNIITANFLNFLRDETMHSTYKPGLLN
jgi:hypothetical protein